MLGLKHNCAGMPRRDFLQLGVGGLFGLGLTDLFRLRAAAAQASGGGASKKSVNCILVWLDGGPSHYETFDPKPDAPAEIRGDFKSIATSVPGIRFSEAVPQLAKAADKLTVLRSICHPIGVADRDTRGSGGVRGVCDFPSVLWIGGLVSSWHERWHARLHVDAAGFAERRAKFSRRSARPLRDQRESE